MNKQELLRMASEAILKADAARETTDADMWKAYGEWQKAEANWQKVNALPDDYEGEMP